MMSPEEIRKSLKEFDWRGFLTDLFWLSIWTRILIKCVDYAEYNY